MKSLKKICSCIVITICGGLFTIISSFAQQDAQYTQYMYNTVAINPAYAGSREVFNINSIYRAQWAGINGAPKTLTASLNTPVGQRGIGLGVSFFNDEIGPSQESNFAVDFAYRIRISNTTKLSFGLKGGFNLYNVNFTNSTLNYDPSDPNSADINNEFSPIIGLGAYLSSDKWYLGMSSPNLLETKHYNDNVLVSTASEKATFYFITGYVFTLNDTTQFKPAVLVKGTSGAPLAINSSANFLFNEKLMLGVAYSLDAAISTLAGFQVSDQIMIGYAYDYDTTDFSNYNSGSHEIVLRFELATTINKIINPRFF
ncbi:type IX secretion system membrane protein PorP/SprF [Tamlana sp. 2201CG12-4]|uniref:PorP/SprF family type IX secretion system membrane protein n=1 Tax=Tamlana sp. 2201CG12-4 TaxID=3112582 RepID=UPI002DBEFBEA|nr:type IX secretion system membrane protein PorP/SprF [Tamlana sp. 2201CG12-4]MEC3908725.1 type IX secretion system membrane protein PorP/SprF [Tamlana sp. 2201CG12-4]